LLLLLLLLLLLFVVVFVGVGVIGGGGGVANQTRPGELQRLSRTIRNIHHYYAAPPYSADNP
jgi:hypothetical protein